MVQAFLSLRPDGFALNVKKREIAILEFTRTMDTMSSGKSAKMRRRATERCGEERQLCE